MQFLTQLNSPKATMGVSNVGAVSTNQVADFAAKGYYTYTIGASLQITISNLTAGQRGSISLLCDANPRAITWVGIGTWVGGVMPTLTASKLTIVSFFHDGIRVVASFGNEL